jgi:hypothetical protein
MWRPTESVVFFAAAAQRAGVAARASGSGSSLTWLWIAGGVVVIIGVAVVVLVLRYMGAGGSVVTGGWVGQAIDAHAKGSALHNAVSAAVRPDALAAGASGAPWHDFQRRADDLAQELHALRDTAADPEDRAHAADALGSLRALRSAMEDISHGGAGAGQAAVVRERLAVFEKSLRALRSPDPHLW